MKFILTTAVILMFSATGFGADPNKPEVGAKRAATLKANIKNFQLGLSYVGESDKPYYSLLLSVPKVNVKQADAFFLVAQLSEEQALKPTFRRSPVEIRPICCGVTTAASVMIVADACVTASV